MMSLICGIKYRTQTNFSMKQKQTHRHREQACSCQRDYNGLGIWGSASAKLLQLCLTVCDSMDRSPPGSSVNRCKLLYTEWTNNKVPLNSTGNYSQYPVINHHGNKYERGCMYMYNWASLVAQMVKNIHPSCNARGLGLIPGLGRSPGGGHGKPLQYSCLENPHGQRSLVSYSSWGPRESDMTERPNTAHMHN